MVDMAEVESVNRRLNRNMVGVAEINVWED